MSSLLADNRVFSFRLGGGGGALRSPLPTLPPAEADLLCCWTMDVEDEHDEDDDNDDEDNGLCGRPTLSFSDSIEWDLLLSSDKNGNETGCC